LRNASSEDGLSEALVQMDAVRPYGESFMSERASSSEETCAN
jgi:hypothetical protein